MRKYLASVSYIISYQEYIPGRAALNGADEELKSTLGYKHAEIILSASLSP